LQVLKLACHSQLQFGLGMPQGGFALPGAAEFAALAQPPGTQGQHAKYGKHGKH
jgi:hypothetical protein